MKAVEEGFVEVVNTNQVDHVGKVLVPTCSKFELNQGDEVNEKDFIYFLTNLGRVREKNRAVWAKTGKPAGHQEIDLHPVLAVKESAVPSWHRFVIARDKFFAKCIQALGRQEDVHVGSEAFVPVGIDS